MMITPEFLETLPEIIVERLSAVNSRYLSKVGSRMKEIGEMIPEEARQISTSAKYGSDIAEIERSLEKATAQNLSDIEKMYKTVARQNLNDAKTMFNASGKVFENFGSNEALQQYVQALYRETAGQYINLTQTTAFAVWGSGNSIAPLYIANRNKIPTSLSDTYINALDEATMAAQTGSESYTSAMRHTLKALADSGIRTVDYATGYSRRLDTAVRQNLLWGLRRCNQETKVLIGEEFGADGYEVSYHSNPRPSHEEMAGRMYAIGEARTVEGVYYPSFDEVADLFDDYNCSHYYMPVILGVSEPRHDPEELAEFKRADNATFEFEGKSYTGYEATQVQRRLESAIRAQKDRTVIAKAAGDDDMRREAQARINQLTSKYAQFTKASGLPSQLERRAAVSGYHRVKVHK